METIVNLNSQRFSLNGISYYKNFMPHVSGNKVRIVNAYDSKLVIMNFTSYQNVSINGVTFGSVADLQFALLPVLFVRSTLGDGSSSENGIVQLSPLEILSFPNRVKIPVVPDIPIWMIGGVTYSKDEDTIFEIEDAGEGKYRIDSIVGNTANDFEIIQGLENSDFAVPPTLPYNVVEIAQVSVYGDTIGSTTPVSGFIKMSSKQFRAVSLNNPVSTKIFLSNEWTTYRLVKYSPTGANTVSGFDSLSLPPVYDGCDIYIINDTEEDVTLLHDSPSVTAPFKFVGGKDFVLAPKQLMHFKYRTDTNKVIPVYPYLKHINLTGWASQYDEDVEQTVYPGFVAAYGFLPTLGRIMVQTPPTGSSLKVKMINRTYSETVLAEFEIPNGSSISADVNEFAGDINAGDFIVFEVIQAGSSTAGQGLMFYIEGIK